MVKPPIKGAKSPGQSQGMEDNTAPFDPQMEVVRDLLLRPDRQKIAGIDERLSKLEEHASNDREFAARLASQLLEGFKKIDGESEKALADRLAKMLHDSFKEDISKAHPQVLQALVPSFGALVTKGIQSECKKLLAYIKRNLLGGANGGAGSQGGASSMAGSGEKQPGALSVERVGLLGATWLEYLFLGLIVLAFAGLFLWLTSTVKQISRHSLMARAEAAMAEQAELAAYPLHFDIVPGSEVLRVTGLLSEASQLDLLDKILRKELPNIQFEKNLKTFFEDAALPQLEALSLSVQTNSHNISLLNQELGNQSRVVQDLASILKRTDQTIHLVRAMQPTKPNFYLNKALAALRNDVEASLSMPSTVLSEDIQALDQAGLEQLVGGLTFAFDPQGELLAVQRALRTGQALAVALDGSHAKRKVNVVAVVKTMTQTSAGDVSKVGQKMLQQAIQILQANGVERESLVLSVIDEDPSSARSQQAEGKGNDSWSWLSHNFVGMSFAD